MDAILFHRSEYQLSAAKRRRDESCANIICSPILREPECHIHVTPYAKKRFARKNKHLMAGLVGTYLASNMEPRIGR